jgi:predicted ATP-grasp superfamily ATP-dependent carboligase
VLIPARDDLALWAADMPHGALSERFCVSSSSRETLEILQDKSRFGEFLSGTGIPYPRTFSIEKRSDIDAIPFDDLDRVFIKPADSHQFRQALGMKGIWAENRDEFEAIWCRLDGQGFRVIAQEYVPGSSADHYFVEGFRDRNGMLTGLFARRRFRIYPPDFGNSSYCESIPLTEVSAAVGHVTALLSELNYRGIFSAEFKRDSRSGVFRILEVNTRAWWYVEFAARCGVNVCRMTYEDAQSHPVAMGRSSYKVGAGCVNLPGDIRSVLAERAGTTISLLQVLVKWARSQFHVFRWDDPAPALSILWGILRRRIAIPPASRRSN